MSEKYRYNNLLQSIMERGRLTPHEVSKVIGVSHQTVRNWITNDCKMSRHMFIELLENFPEFMQSKIRENEEYTAKLHELLKHVVSVVYNDFHFKI